MRIAAREHRRVRRKRPRGGGKGALEPHAGIGERLDLGRRAAPVATHARALRSHGIQYQKEHVRQLRSCAGSAARERRSRMMSAAMAATQMMPTATPNGTAAWSKSRASRAAAAQRLSYCHAGAQSKQRSSARADLRHSLGERPHSERDERSRYERQLGCWPSVAGPVWPASLRAPAR